MQDRASLAELLRWYVEAGADEAIGEVPIDRFAAGAAPRPIELGPAAAPTLPSPTSGGGSAVAGAKELAEAAEDLAALEAAVRAYEGCVLRHTAMNTVFADGNPAAPLVVVGEAPGADEDRMGRPFVGRAGQLLDRMLAAIGIDRSGAYIMNVLYWRPPGNRKPTPGEIAACLPFVRRQIALVAPKVVLVAGGTATSALLGQEGITRLRGKWFELAPGGLARPIPTLATFHPSYLLRTPQSKKDAWRDLLSLQTKLEELR
jgi:uracil-DNA glycosylase